MKLYCIGIGPGGVEQMTLRAARALEKCDCVAGYGQIGRASCRERVCKQV